MRSTARSADTRPNGKLHIGPLFRAPLEAELVDAVRTATHGGWALGGERFSTDRTGAQAARCTLAPRPASQGDKGAKAQLDLL